MRYKLLGRSGLRVSELCFGTMTFGEEWGWGASKDECRKMYQTFVEAGGNFIDTANRYTEGTSEEIVGELIRDQREKIVLATKYSLYMNHGDPNSAGNHRKNMVQAAERSLKRLNTDYIDLYWLHAWDYTTPVDEVMRAFDDLVASGKVLYIGVSDTPAWVISRANMLAELRGWTQFVGLQVEYSLIERGIERDLLPMARELDLAVTPWGAIGGGVLTGKYSRKQEVETEGNRYKPEQIGSSGRLSEQSLAVGDKVVAMAKELGHSPAQVALNWVRQQPGTIIPIIGARTDEQLRDNLACLEWNLTDEQMTSLSDLSKIDRGFPHSFLEADFVRDLLFAGTYNKIDNHHQR